jgi:hypothetical protein
MQVIANLSKTVSEIGIKGFANMPIVKADLVKTVCKVLDEAKSIKEGIKYPILPRARFNAFNFSLAVLGCCVCAALPVSTIKRSS